MKLSSLIAKAEVGLTKAAKHTVAATKDFAKEMRVEWQAIKIADGEAARLKLQDSLLATRPADTAELQAAVEAAEISERADQILARRIMDDNAKTEREIRVRVSKAIRTGVIPVDGVMLRAMDRIMSEKGL